MTYSSFSSSATVTGNITFAINGHSGTLNLTNADIVGYDNSNPLYTKFTIQPDENYQVLSSCILKMSNNTLVPNTHYEFSNNILSIYNAQITNSVDINIVYTGNIYAITFASSNSSYGSVSLTSANIPHGTTYSVNSSNQLVFSNGTIITPTASPTSNTHTYAFSGWSLGSGIIEGQATFTANFTATSKTFTVTFTLTKNTSSGVLSDTSITVPYGTTYSVNSSKQLIFVDANGNTIDTVYWTLTQTSGYYDSLDYWTPSSGIITSDTTITGVIVASCFTAGTLVWVDNGSESGIMKNIEDLQVGDYVYSYSENGEITINQITQTFIHEKTQTTIIKINAGTEIIETTSVHPFLLSDGTWVEAQELKAGDILVTATGELEIQSITYENREETLYNIEVENDNTYFITQEKIVVHNKEN